MEKNQKIRDDLKDFEKYKPIVRNVPEFEKFRELSEDEVRKLINKMQTKSCEIDVLPTKLLKSFHSSELLPIITGLVNLSLTQ